MRIRVIKVFILFAFCLSGVLNNARAQVSVNPTRQRVCFNNAALFHLQNNTDPNATFRWQDSSTTGWNNIVATSNIIGVTNDSIIFLHVSSLLNNYKVRCIIDSAGLGIHKDTTKASLLFVRAAFNKPKITANQHICFGAIADTLELSQFPSGGDSVFTYQWQKSSNAIVWVDLVNANGTFLSIDTFHTSTYFRLKANSLSGCGSLFTDTVFVKFHPKLIKPSLLKNNFRICYNGNPDSLTVFPGPIPGNSDYHYQWQISTNNINWVDLLNDTTSSKSSIQSIVASTFYRVKATHRYGCGVYFSDTATVIPLSPIIKPAIFGAQTVCFNEDPDTLEIVTSPFLGTDVTYQWQSSINGTLWVNLLGKTAKELVLAKNDVTKFYRVKATWKNCTSLFTDSVLVSVFQDMTSGTIKTSQAICFGSTPSILSFQNIPSGGGGSYTYQWQLSTDSILFTNITGATGLVYSPPSLTTTSFYRVIVTSVNGCGILFTNIIKIKVYAPFVGSDVQSNDTICYDFIPDTLRLITNPTGGNGVYNYQWQSSTNNVNWVNITGQTNKLYKPNAIKVTTYYRVIIFSGAGCGSYTSNAVTIKVWPSIIKARISSNQSICYNTPADTLRVVQLAQGGNTKFSYQWQSSNEGSSWVDIAGETGLKLFTGPLTTAKYYRIVATSLFGCGSIASDSIKINVYSELLPAVIYGNQSICYNAIPTKFGITTKPIGANGLYSYQWQVSNDSINFQNQVAATDTVLQVNKSIANKYYRLKVISTLGCGVVYSNIIKVSVYKKFEGATIGNSVKLCYGYVPVPLYMTQKPKGGSLIYTYQWQSSADSINWGDMQGQTADTLPMTNLLRTTYFRLINSSTFSCGSDTSNVVTISSLKLPDTTFVKGISEVCRNQQELFYSLDHKSGDYSYEWNISKGAILTDITKTSVFITWDNTEGSDTIFIKQTNKETGCFNFMKFPILFKETEAPTITRIIRKSNSNILVSKDSTIGIHYQWGFINKVTKITEDIPNANLRYILLPHVFDTTRYIYYVKTWFLDCITTTYYNFDALSLGVPTKNKHSFAVYPNPTSGKFNLEGIDLSDVTLTCFDVLGNKVELIKNISVNTFEFKENLPSGIYLLVFNTSEGILTERIILSR